MEVFNPKFANQYITEFFREKILLYSIVSQSKKLHWFSYG